VKNEKGNPIFIEIDEELKRDKLLAFATRHSHVILGIIVSIAVGIAIYLSLRVRNQTKGEDITSALVNIMQNSRVKHDVLLSGLLEDAPAELKPILQIIKSGELMMRHEFAKENLKPLLELSHKHGVHQVWKDVALIIYASYPTNTPENLIKILKPLTEENRPFKLMALELMAMIHENDGQHGEAIKLLDKVAAHTEVSASQKSRVSMLSSYIGAKAASGNDKGGENKK
jgi:hypothetical protein